MHGMTGLVEIIAAGKAWGECHVRDKRFRRFLSFKEEGLYVHVQ